MCIYAAEACLYAPRIQCIRLEELEVHTATLSLAEELEVHTSTIARSAYLQKTLLPGSTLPRMEELEVHTSTLQCIHHQVHTLRLARGAYLYAPRIQDSGLKSSRYIPLRSQEGPELEVYTFRRARFLDPKRARGVYLYAPRDRRARGAYLYAPRIECPGWKELEVHTSTLPGGSRARGTYLQKSSLPGELGVYTSTLPGGSKVRGANLYKSSRCIPSEEFPGWKELEVARGAYLELPECPGGSKLEEHTPTLSEFQDPGWKSSVCKDHRSRIEVCASLRARIELKHISRHLEAG